MANERNPDFDVAIIGGGPAGAGTAAYLAKAGVNCVVFEKEQFPRPHVGESLVPSTTRVFKDLNFLEVMDAEGFPKKLGAVWTANARSPVYHHDWTGLDVDCRADIRFDERTMTDVDRNYTYHVDRGRFDLLLLQHARKLGASVREGVRVSSVDLEARPYPIIYVRDGKTERRLSSRLIVDASGRNTVVGRAFGLKVNDPVFCQFALHTWFDGFDRGNDANADFIFVHFLPTSNSWLWQIPITNSITSFGVVTQKRHFPKLRNSREAFFWDCIKTRPEIFDRLKRAERIRPFREEGDYSYAMTQICGDRFLLVGDAARFVDPIFSSGVSIALNGARLASKDIIQALETGEFDRTAFSSFENEMKRGTHNWYRFIRLYYRLNILFTMFIRDPTYRVDMLKLLQGDLYDEDDPPVLTRMNQIVTQVESDPTHVWHKLLGTLTDNSYRVCT